MAYEPGLAGVLFQDTFNYDVHAVQVSILANLNISTLVVLSDLLPICVRFLDNLLPWARYDHFHFYIL